MIPKLFVFSDYYYYYYYYYFLIIFFLFFIYLFIFFYFYFILFYFIFFWHFHRLPCELENARVLYNIKRKFAVFGEYQIYFIV